MHKRLSLIGEYLVSLIKFSPAARHDGYGSCDGIKHLWFCRRLQGHRSHASSRQVTFQGAKPESGRPWTAFYANFQHNPPLPVINCWQYTPPVSLPSLAEITLPSNCLGGNKLASLAASLTSASPLPSAALLPSAASPPWWYNHRFPQRYHLLGDILHTDS
jgi:hypothetical protein